MTAPVPADLQREVEAAGLEVYRNAAGGLSLFQPMPDGKGSTIVGSARRENFAQAAILEMVRCWLDWQSQPGLVRATRAADHRGLYLSPMAGPPYKLVRRKTQDVVFEAETLPEIGRYLESDMDETHAPEGVDMDGRQRAIEQAVADAEEFDRRELALAEVDRTYGAGAEYDRDRVTAEVRHHLGQGVLAMLEAGRRLIWLREREGHGHWLPLLERIGIEQTAAKRMMQAARKFGAGDSNRALVHDLKSVTKVYELAMLDDDDLEELREGGTVAGATLDDIQRMSPTELRAALRAERKERNERASAASRREQRQKQQIEDLNARLDDKQEFIEKMKDPDRDLRGSLLWERTIRMLSIAQNLLKAANTLEAKYREGDYTAAMCASVAQNAAMVNGVLQDTIDVLEHITDAPIDTGFDVTQPQPWETEEGGA